MAQQLIYTSAPKLLDAGRSGFGTVARSRSLGALASGAIERVSQFANLRGYDRGRIIHAYRRITAGSQKLYVLTRIRDCGSDYTGRTNHIAHHLVVSPEEVARAEARGLTPSDVMRQFPWRDSWDGPPRSLDPSDDADLGAFRPLGKASGRAAFAKITGEPLHARLLAWDEAPRSGVVIVPEHADPLELLTEACAEFARQPWSRTFTTSLETTDELGEFDWVLIKSTTADLVLPRIGSRPRFDLTKPTSLPLPTEELKSIPVPTATTENPRSHVRQTTRPPDGFSQNSPLPTCSTHGQAIENEAQKAAGAPSAQAGSGRAALQKERRNRKNMLWALATGFSIIVGSIFAFTFLDEDAKTSDRAVLEGNSKNTSTTKECDKLSDSQKSQYEKDFKAMGVTAGTAKTWIGLSDEQIKNSERLLKCIKNHINNPEITCKESVHSVPGRLKDLMGAIKSDSALFTSESIEITVQRVSGFTADFEISLLDDVVLCILIKRSEELQQALADSGKIKQIEVHTEELPESKKHIESVKKKAAPADERVQNNVEAAPSSQGASPGPQASGQKRSLIKPATPAENSISETLFVASEDQKNIHELLEEGGAWEIISKALDGASTELQVKSGEEKWQKKQWADRDKLKKGINLEGGFSVSRGVTDLKVVKGDVEHVISIIVGEFKPKSSGPLQATARSQGNQVFLEGPDIVDFLHSYRRSRGFKVEVSMQGSKGNPKVTISNEREISISGFERIESSSAPLIDNNKDRHEVIELCKKVLDLARSSRGSNKKTETRQQNLLGAKRDLIEKLKSLEVPREIKENDNASDVSGLKSELEKEDQRSSKPSSNREPEHATITVSPSDGNDRSSPTERKALIIKVNLDWSKKQ